MDSFAEIVTQWARDYGIELQGGTLDEVLRDLLGKHNDSLQTECDALRIRCASIQKVCEAGWPRGEPCRICRHVGRHTDTCYVRFGTGYDLLEEHEACRRENDELRAALASHMPVNGKHILAGQKVKSLRSKMRDRFLHREPPEMTA